VLANRTTWPAFIANAGVGGSYLAFAGCGVPYLQQVYGMPRVAPRHNQPAAAGSAFGSLAIGVISTG